MKSILLSLMIVLSASAGSADQQLFPHVIFEYASSLDLQMCPHGIAKEALSDLSSSLPAIQNLWNDNEAALLGTTVRITSKSFVRHEETASLMLCRSLKGQAEPLLLPVWPFLMKTTEGHPLDTKFFVGMTFHEILHRFIDHVLGGMYPSTPLLQKYAGEDPLVRRHLHVDALQKTVYMQLGRSAEINAIVASDSRFYGPAYARAWDIVNNIEGEDAFLRELRIAAPRP